MRTVLAFLAGAVVGVWAYQWWLDGDVVRWAGLSRGWSLELVTPRGDRWTNVRAHWVVAGA